MPVAALLSALARVAAATGTTALRAGATGFRASAAAARTAARALGRSIVRFSQAVGRIIRRTGASIAKATRQVMNLLRRSILRIVNFVQNRIRAAQRRFSQFYQSFRNKIDKDIERKIIEGFNDSVVQSNAQFEDAIVQAIEEPEDTKARRNLKIDALRHRFVQRFTDVAFDVLRAQREMTDEELMEIFRLRIAPEIAAARVIATEDPSSILDQDAMYHLALVAENFLEMASQMESDMDALNLVGYLTTEGVMAAKAAAFRQQLLAQAVRDRIAVDIDSAIMASVSKFANTHAKALGDEELAFIDKVVSEVLGAPVLYSQPSRIMRLAHSLSGISFILSKTAIQFIEDVMRAAMRGQHSSAHKYIKILRDGIRKLSDVPQAELRVPDEVSLPTDERAEEIVQETEQAQAETLKEQEEPFEDAEEDDVLYGIWETNATRMVQENCPDCIALETLTSMYPIPVAELPTPGVETLCAQRCACAIRVVNADEFDQIRGQWSTVWQRFTGETMPDKFEKEDATKVKALVNVMLGDAKRFSAWAKRFNVQLDDV
jgi:hypothetical protein